MRRSLALCALLGVIAACAVEPREGGTVEETQPEDTTTSVTDPRRVTPQTTSEPSNDVYLPQDLVDTALAQAMSDYSYAASDLTVVRAVQVRWPNAALGCGSNPSAQVLTDGYWVVFDGPDLQLDYRSGLDGVFRNCIGGEPPADTLVDR